MTYIKVEKYITRYSKNSYRIKLNGKQVYAPTREQARGIKRELLNKGK